MKPEIIQNGEFIEVIGHYDDEVQCAKMTLLAELYAVEHRDGYAKFRLEDADRLGLVNGKLEFVGREPRPPQPEFPFYGSYSITVLGTLFTGYFGDALQFPISYPSDQTINASNTAVSVYNSQTSFTFSPAISIYSIVATYNGDILDRVKAIEYWTSTDSTKRTVNYTQEGDIKRPEESFNFVLNSSNETLYINIITEDPKISIDLTTLSGWSGLSDGTHSITVKAKATGYRDSEASQAVSVTKQPEQNTVTLTNTASGGSAGIIYFDCNLYEGEYDGTKDAIAVIKKNETVSLPLDNGLYSLVLPGIVSGSILELSGDVAQAGTATHQFIVSGSGTVSFYAGANF